MTEQTIVLSCKEDEDKLERERRWTELPTDLLSLILQHLFLGDRHVSNLVLNSGNPIDTLRLPLPPPAHSPYFDSPCLMFFYVKLKTWELFHSLCNDSYYLDLPELLNAEICYSKYGWLLMSQGKKAYFFFNPSTKVKIELPLTEHEFGQVCFTSPPTSADECVIFGIFSTSTIGLWEFGYIKLGEKEWDIYEYRNTYRSLLTNCSPVFSNGLFYCLDQSGNLGVFNPDEEECHWVQYRKCFKNKISNEVFLQSYMAEVDGEIWSVFVTHDDRRVGVYKLDLNKFVWRPLENLGNKCLYVSPRVSFAETCAVKSLGNKIYFNVFHGKSGVVYSLANKMYHSVGGGFASKEAYRLTKMRHATWFKPTCGESES